MYNVSSVKNKSNMVRTRDACLLLILGVFVFALGVVGGILIGIYSYNGGPNGKSPDVNVQCISKSINVTVKPSTQSTSSAIQPTAEPSDCMAKTCPKRQARFASNEPEIFAPLTNSEMTKTREFMIKEGIVSDRIGSQLTLKNNYITSMDVIAPNKEDIVRYLDRNGQFPGRHARVTVVRGAREPPDLMIYNVGPLEKNEMTVENLYSDGDLVFEIRPIDSIEIELYRQLLEPVGDVLEPLLKESFDGAHLNGGGLDWFPYQGPPSLKEKEREARASVYFRTLDEYWDMHLLDMLPVSALIHCPGNDFSKWFVHSFYYLNQGPYDTAADLVNAYNNGSLRRVKLPAGYTQTVEKRIYVGRDDTKPFRAYSQMPPPRTYEPQGPRYTITGHHVQWMGWSFDVSSNMMRGGALYDIRYKNSRIAYELSLNEISLIYGSGSFEDSNVVYTDSTYGVGLYNGVIKDVDCPGHASLLETSFYDAYSGTAVTHKSICVFEADGEGVSWRHKYTSYQAGLRLNYLVVRLTTTLVNYDYIVDYEFHLDGKVYIKVRATGFIHAGFWDPENPFRDKTKDSGDARDSFGFRVTDYGHGLIHDHTFGFKVDLDILDRNNSFEVIHFKAGDATDAFKAQNPAMKEKPDYFAFNVTRYLEYETVQTERGYKLDPVHPKFWTVVNENYRNHWGAKRGYQLLPLSTSIQTMVDTHPAMQTVSFTKYTCAATRRKDTEPYLSSVFDSYRFDNPKGDLEKQLNDESIVNEDIVNWMAVGFLHVPTSEDVPMTVFVETGFVLKPFNFFDETDVYDMPQYYNSINRDRQSPPSVEPCLEDVQNIGQ